MYFINNAASAKLVYESVSDGVKIKVLEDENYRWLQLGNNTIHSAMKLSETWRTALPYYPALLSVLLFKKNPENILLMGLGGGELVRNLAHNIPDANLTALEKSTKMIEVFQTWFNPNQEQLSIVNTDVCHWRDASNREYDIVFLDVYGDMALPECMYAEDLYSHIYRQLSETGVLAANLAVKDEQEAVSLMIYIRKVFKQHTLCLAVEGHLNLIVLAFKVMPTDFDRVSLQRVAESVYVKAGFDAEVIIDNIINHNQGLI